MKRTILAALALMMLLGGCQSDPTPTANQLTEVTTLPTEETVTQPTQQIQTDPVTEEAEPISMVFDPYAIIDTMTTEELVGQLFLARCPGKQDAAPDVSNYHLAGYVLFGSDIQNESPASLTETVSSYQQNAKIPLLIAVDEEGGTVTRVSSYTQFRSVRFPSPRDLYDEGGLGLVTDVEAEKAKLLTSLGINVNLAPVCDITTDPDAFMYKRSLGRDPQTTGQYIAATVMTMSRNGLGSMLKHFPGYGNNVDTHIGIAVDERTLAELESNDLVPFQYGISMGCGAIMVSHTIVKCLDAEHPASLSSAVVNYIRNTMDYNGVIATDDLIMQAITDRYGDEEAAIMAVEAGVDLLCCSSYQVQYRAVLQAVIDGRLDLNNVKASVARILQWKHHLELL